MTVLIRVQLLIAVFICMELNANGQSLRQDAEDYNISGSAEIDYNLVQNDDDYLMPTVIVEIGSLHFEARHNYEERNSASFWGGVNFETGNELSLKVTPLAGIVIGSVAGFAPGLEAELTYGMFSLTVNSEYFVNSESFDDSYFYSWNELSISPAEWLSLGAVAERTKLYGESGDFQIGLLAGLSYGNYYVAAYLFDPEKNDRNWLFALGYEF